MKRIILLSLVSLLFSCGGTTGKYEKVIVDFAQTDSRGMKLNMNFKVEKLEDVRRVTVMDSIKIITDNFNTERDKQMASLEKTVSLFTENIEKAKAAYRPSQTMINSYQSVSIRSRPYFFASFLRFFQKTFQKLVKHSETIRSF